MTALSQSVRVERYLAILRDEIVEALSVIMPAGKVLLGATLGSVSSPRPARPYVHIDLLTLPQRVGSFTDEKESRDAPALIRVKVKSFLQGRGYKVRLNGLPANYTGQAGDSLTDIRDGMIAAIADLGEKVTTTVTDTDEFTINPISTGDIYSASTPTREPFLSLVSEGPLDFVEYMLGERMFTARIQCYSESGKMGSAGAHEIIGVIYDALDTSEVSLRFVDNRFSVLPISPLPNLTGVGVTDANAEQRASFDIRINCSSLSTHSATQIKTVHGSIVVGDLTQDFLVDVP